MDKLEDKIIKEVYKIETKHTFIDIFRRMMISILLILILFILGQWLYEVYTLQRTFDLLQLFNEDTSIIRNYLLDTCITIYDETPKILLLPIIFCGVFFIYFILKTSQNFYKIKNKLSAILKYWSNH